VARHADATGWDGVYLADHFMGAARADEPNLEATACLPAIAAATSRVRVGPLVLGNTYRHPAVVANWAASLDHVSGGRAVLGLGAGWQANEHESYGLEFPSRGDRVDALDEACRVVRGLLDEPEVTMTGHRYVLDGARCDPKPVQAHLPLLIGGHGDRMLALVARRADEWNMWAGPELLRRRGQVLDRACERLDRDPASVTRSAQAAVHITGDRAAITRFRDSSPRPYAFAGPPSEFAAFALDMAAAGADEVVVPDADLGVGNERLDHMDAILAAVREAFPPG
jgi:alkanesulfonate monooxygenase SsuD/methylene tetrahydromethanopterin reductase-like flavin-dependent oxidoreductase (luciferase family)